MLRVSTKRKKEELTKITEINEPEDQTDIYLHMSRKDR